MGAVAVVVRDRSREVLPLHVEDLESEHKRARVRFKAATSAAKSPVGELIEQIEAIRAVAEGPESP
jgi:hypothetical protein